jgi:L-ascorbate metabolism protein UlaG (beta-lactamase superfamily)
VRLRTVPAAHPDLEVDTDGHPCRVGYLLEYRGRKIYHSGDTSVCPELIEDLQKEGEIDVAFISVNERNYFREHAGIIGNMSIRDAFQLAEEVNVGTLVPMHWDMFTTNSVFPEEIELLFKKLKPSFALTLTPSIL